MTDALGYVTIHVRIEGIASYKELQCALVVPDLSGLGKRVPVILGTPTIYRLCRQMKESEIHTAPSEWQHAIASYEASLALRAMNVDPNAKYPTNTGQNPSDLDEVVLLRGKYSVPAFTSVIVHGQTKKTFMLDQRLNVMIQAPYAEDEAHLSRLGFKRSKGRTEKL